MAVDARTIVLHEVGLRDGLQMERQVVPTDVKARWAGELVAAGLDVVQVGSFVHPEKVPQLADTDRLFGLLGKPAGATFSALILNERGLERGLACGVELLCMGVSASETHSRKNTGMSVAEATRRIVAIAHRAIEAGRQVQVSVQSAFGCGYEGAVPESRVLDVVRRFLDEGLTRVSLADTAGHAVPDQVERLFGAVFAAGPGVEAACHFHNTYGLALANCCAAQRVGVTWFESSVAGLGGCPFTKVAGGNTCTEDFVHMLQRSGQRSDVRLDRLVTLAGELAAFFGRDLPGSVYRAGTVADAVGSHP